MTWRLSSTAFREGQIIPKRFTCQGADVSPPLAWTAPPPGTKSFALIVDDPDAPGGTWVHWVVYHLPSTVRELPEHVPTDDQLTNGTLQGINDFGRVGYGGPCPPPGAPHRYVFCLYALDERLDPPTRATKAQLEPAMTGHILGQVKLIGRYQR